MRDQAGYTLAELSIVVAITGLLMAAVFTIYQVTQRTTFRASGTEASLVQVRSVVDKFAGDFRMVGAERLLYSAPITAATSTSIRFEGDIDNTLDVNNNPVRVIAQANCPTCPTVGTGTTVVVSDARNIACGTTISFADGPVIESHKLTGTPTTTTCGAPNNDTTTLALDTTTPTATCSQCIPLTTYFPVGSYVYTVESVNWVWDSVSQKLCRKVNADCPAITNPNTWNDDTEVIASGVTNFSLTYLDLTGATLALSGGSLPNTSWSSVRAVRVSVTVSSQIGDQTVTRTMELTARSRAQVP